MGLAISLQKLKAALGSRRFGGLVGGLGLAGVAGAYLQFFPASAVAERSAGAFALGGSLVTSTHQYSFLI